jgi:hypothetical protein
MRNVPDLTASLQLATAKNKKGGLEKSTISVLPNPVISRLIETTNEAAECLKIVQFRPFKYLSSMTDLGRKLPFSGF